MQSGTPSANSPPPHWVVDRAFGADLASRLLSFALERESAFVDTNVGNGAVKAVRKTVRSSRATRDFGALQSELEERFRGILPAAISRLKSSPFTLTGLSMELAAHGDRDFYQRHIDTFVGGDAAKPDRVLTGVYYVHVQPRPFTGGDLRLHSIRPAQHGGSYVDVEARHDRLVLFPAWVPHEVRPVSCPGGSFGQSRFAINCWYLSKPD